MNCENIYWLLKKLAKGENKIEFLGTSLDIFREWSLTYIIFNLVVLKNIKFIQLITFYPSFYVISTYGGIWI